MPFTVDQLISEHQRLVTVPREASAKEALELMIEHDFNQLPVVDSDGKLLGMVTSDSILRAMKNFGTPVDKLQVAHTMIAANKHFLDDDLFELLDDLRDEYAVVIVDGDDKAIGVVTSYDTTEYFRRRAQDMMYVEDIESALKEYISSAFTNGQEELDEAARATAVSEATSSDADTRKQFNRALVRYLNEVEIDTSKFDEKKAKEIFDSCFPKPALKGFEDLSLGEFNQLLLHNSTWPQVSNIFNLDKEAIRRLLDDVRKTRNDLFHFRGDISPNQRAQLQFCADWLNRQRPTPAIAPSATGKTTSAVIGPIPADAGQSSESQDSTGNAEPFVPDCSIIPVEDAGSPDSRYAALAQYLQRLPDTQESVPLTFEEVEAIIGDRLPANARQHRSWWANDSVSHSQSQQWLEAGWRVNRISIADQRVSFARNRERERLYIDFFSAVIADLQTANEIPVRANSPSGLSWQIVTALPKNSPQPAIFAMVFASRSQFRVELHIGTSNKTRNAKVFDQLFASKVEIESAVGEPLSWEPLRSGKAYRIALYRKGTITGTAAELEDLRAWARDAMARLYRGIAQRAEAALMESNTQQG